MFDNSEGKKEPSLLDEFKFLQATLLHLTFKPADRFSGLIPPSLRETNYSEEDFEWLPRPNWFYHKGMPLLQLPDGWYSGHLTLRQRLAPLIVIEFLFPGEEYSLLSKPNQQQPVVGVQTVKKIYQSVPRVRNYAIFNPTTNEIHGFRLGGDRFQRKELTDGRLLIENAELILGTWFGSFRGMERTWLRWMNLDGEVIWMPEEEEEEDR